MRADLKSVLEDIGENNAIYIVERRGISQDVIMISESEYIKIVGQEAFGYQVKKRSPNERRSIPKTERIEMWLKAEKKCQYCGREIDWGDVNIDHIIPFEKGGSCDKSNLIVSCRSCNSYKGTFSIEEFRDSIKNKILNLESTSLFGMAKQFGTVNSNEISITFEFEKSKTITGEQT